MPAETNMGGEFRLRIICSNRPPPILNLVRFAHNWNDGMLEYWNNGCNTRHHLEKFGDSWDK